MIDSVPPKRPPGRPRLAPDLAHTARVEIRLTPAQRDKLDALGGASWVRRQIERAKPA